MLFIRSLEVGGAEGQLVALAKALHAQGVPVRALAFYPGGALRPALEAAGVPVEDIGKRGRWDLPFFLWRLYRRLRVLRPDVLYAWLPTANTLAATVGRLAAVPRIVWGVRASSLDFSRYDWLHRVDFELSRFAAPLADRIICNSEAGCRFHAASGYPAHKMTVIENGIDTRRFRFDAAGRERVHREWGIGADEMVIGQVARLDPMKDHETFLHAAAMLARDRQNVKFVCVGAGEAGRSAALKRLAHGLGLDGKAIWAGERRDLAAVYSAFDIASSSSYGEGFSNAVAEAMACERPCVVTDVGDSARIVGDTGFVVPAKDAEALAQGWLRALDLTPASRQRLGVLARQRIEAEYSVTRMVERTREVLQC